MKKTRRGSARPLRALVLFLILALSAGLVGAPTAEAGQTDNPPPTPPTSSSGADDSRTQVLHLWKYGGPSIKEAAGKALLGSDSDIKTFLASDLSKLKATDDRISVDRVLAAGGQATKDAAQRALDASDDASLLAFLRDGWKVPWEQDQRIRVDQILATGGPQLQLAAQKALDANTVGALQSFLKDGWQVPYEQDQRIRIDQILAAGGPEVKRSAQEALDANTAAAYAQFLNHDLTIAQARDQETATIAQLAGAAKDAGEQAAKETQAAKDASARAITEAALAKKAAEAAAAASAAAHDDSNAASAAARQAADAADKAAVAAREAVSAANAASVAARVAAGAATRAASAASKAGQAASAAYSAASAADTDAKSAESARKAAGAARDAAIGAQDAAKAAKSAGEAINRAKDAISAAGRAGQDASAAAKAASDASKNASAAAADAATARRAAAAASANAARATRAAQAASGFADTAATAAFEAQAAAERAAADANAAAAAADDAALHAGQAADAANQATLHANAATAAAQAAITAADQAKKVYDAARSAEKTRIATETEQADEAALVISRANDQAPKPNGGPKPQSDLRDAETNRLIAEATAVGTPAAVAVTDARKVAMTLSQTDGSWTKAAADDVLSGPDALALDFVQHGIVVAAGQDDRVALGDLEQTSTDNFKAAAEAALAGSDADVASFLRDQNYPQRETDDRIAVDRILAAAQQSKDIATIDAAQKALDAQNDQALRDFLATGQYVAAGQDRRIKANNILASDTSGPESKGAAQVALDGSPAMLADFVTSGQYSAAQHDLDSAAHDAVVSAYLAQASQAAATASQNANEAQRVAATARHAAAEAEGYRQQASKDADQANGYAQQAHQSAVDAQNSAVRAAQSAATARNAATSAKQSARKASLSAAWANSSASFAASKATEAYGAAKFAFQRAIDAGRDAEQAKAAAKEAVDASIAKVKEAQKQAHTDLLLHCENVPKLAFDECVKFATQSDADRIAEILDRDRLCDHLGNVGAGIQKQCYADELSPTFRTDFALSVATTALSELAAIYGTVAATEIAVTGGILCTVSEPCGLLAASIIPEGTAFTSWIGIAGVNTLALTRAEAMLEESLVDAGALVGRRSSNAVDMLTECAVNSFTGDTPVLLADGSREPISTVRPGEQVLATNPVSGETRAEPVVKLITGSGPKNIVSVTIRDSSGAESVVQATAWHPFWVGNGKGWTGASRLVAGDQVRTSSGGVAQVVGTATRTYPVKVYNLTVSSLHTYYIAPGRTVSALVHNTGCSDIALGKERIDGNEDSLFEFAMDIGAAPHWEWSDDATWYQHVLNAIKDGKTRIHFNLDGIPDARAYADLGVGADPVLDYGRLTAWELNEIRQDPSCWSRVKFYRNGKEWKNPFA
ncbi:polymorphic toxin-type HINT domain-containing protein [Amycolatopsis sp. Poz14]|uniref:polymorphic toxin-type HINT domain-containing protein n=1 Tax=Amycolatopsis sp. Poz14 TaxID=1447705 RepID=UPI001EE798DF|nr:polymorphic toxin-type HINT domain-containing protein [Amycolatopsis sp. Poz14]MCG3750253.1 hypothetical protein [Amycolatopsis sp. Poz14]